MLLCKRRIWVFMTKEVRKSIIIRSKLMNKFLKSKNEQSRNNYRKQRTLPVMLIIRARLQYFSSLDLKLIADNKKFWKTIKPLFLDKISHRALISLTKDGKTINEDLQVAEIFHNYFNNVICSLCDRNVPTETSIACSQNSAISKFKESSRHSLR